MINKFLKLNKKILNHYRSREQIALVNRERPEMAIESSIIISAIYLTVSAIETSKLLAELITLPIASFVFEIAINAEHVSSTKLKTSWEKARLIRSHVITYAVLQKFWNKL